MASPGNMDTGDGPEAPAPSSRPTAARLLSVALSVALCAAIAAGSCIGSVSDSAERLDTSSDLYLALLSGGLALAVGLLFLLLVSAMAGSEIIHRHRCFSLYPVDA